jgi:hypothetical protein
VLDHVELGVLELQAAPHQGFGFGVAAHVFQQPRAVVQRMQAVLQCRRRVGVEDLAPAGHGGVDRTAAFQQVAQVELGRRKAGLQVQRAAVGCFGRGLASGGREQRAPVEAGHRAQG